MTYTMTPKRKQADFLHNNWKVSLEVFMLRNQGWTFQAIGDRFNLTRQRTSKIYQKMSRLTVEEAEKVQKYVTNYTIDSTSK